MVTAVREKYKADDIALCVQECVSYDWHLRPHFFEPINTDEHVTFGKDDGGKRGVATYYCGNTTTVAVNGIDTKNEIVTVIGSFLNNRRKVTKVGIINCYRNISKNYERTVKETKEAINRIIDHLVSINVGQFVICGDFNAVDFRFAEKGAHELWHPDWFHQSNEKTAKHKINKAFTNMQNAGILEVRESCENVDAGFGHKCCVMYVGKRPIANEKETKEVAKIGDIKKISAAYTPSFRFQELLSPELIESAAVELTDMFVEIKNRGTKTCAVKTRHKNAIMISLLDKYDSDIISKQSAAKEYYAFVEGVKKGFSYQSADALGKPPIQETGGTLVKKLSELYVADRQVVNRLLGKIFPVDFNNIGLWHESTEAFKTLILSTSNSGAKDAKGLSLKLTKVMF